MCQEMPAFIEPDAVPWMNLGFPSHSVSGQRTALETLTRRPRIGRASSRPVITVVLLRQIPRLRAADRSWGRRVIGEAGPRMADSGPSRRSSAEPERLHTVFSPHSNCGGLLGSARSRAPAARAPAAGAIKRTSGSAAGAGPSDSQTKCLWPGWPGTGRALSDPCQ